MKSARVLVCLLLIALVAVIGAIAGCSSTTSATSNKPASAACTADTECASGACLDLGVFASDGGCSAAGKACSKTCASDVDCMTLGAGFKCFAGCGTAKICGATQ